MESDVNFSWTLLKKEYKPILTGMGFFLILLFLEKASFALSAISFVFCFFLLLASIFDIRYGLIFDKFLIYFLAVFFFVYFLQNDILPKFSEGVLAAFAAAVIFLLLQIISKNGMGGGDIKFVFCLGFWLGFEKLLLTFYIAVIFALIAVVFIKKYRQKGALIPFAPFLSFGAIISFLYGEQILNLYWEFLL